MLFLAEAFTRPRVMERLAKLGFSQSYTYFTWRNTKQELTEYMRELTHDAGARILSAQLLAQYSRHPAGALQIWRPAGVSQPGGAGGDPVFKLRNLRARLRAGREHGRPDREAKNT